MEYTTSEFAISDTIKLIALVTLAIYIIFSVVMHYHWKEYAFDDAVTKLTYTTYLISTLPLMLVCLLVAYFAV